MEIPDTGHGTRLSPERGSITVPSPILDNRPATLARTAGLEQQLTIKEVAGLTGTSEQTVRRWIAAGQLRAYYYGKRALRIDPADLRAMRREVNPATYAVMGGGAA